MEGTAVARPSSPTVVGLAGVAWVALVAAAWWVGRPLREATAIFALPIFGQPDRLLSGWTVVDAALGAVLVVMLPRWCAHLPWRRMLLAVAGGALLWGVAVSGLRGWDRPTASQSSHLEYAAVVSQARAIGVGDFIRTFDQPDVLRHYPIHVQGHPLGIALLYIGLDDIGLGGPGRAAALLILAGAAAPVAVLVSFREVVGEASARRAAPFLAAAPAVVWMVTSADALFTAVAACGIALVVLATGPGRRAAPLAFAGGLVLAGGLHLSYGLVPLLLVPAVVVVARRSWRVVPWAALGGALVFAAFTTAGFWWLDGLHATRTRYEAGIAATRPFAYFVWLANPAALALASGPAAAVALATTRRWRGWLLSGAALVAVLVADASGLSKGEVERIWLPFVPWILAVTGGMAVRSTRGVRLLLAAQVAVALGVESLVATPW